MEVFCVLYSTEGMKIVLLDSPEAQGDAPCCEGTLHECEGFIDMVYSLDQPDHDIQPDRTRG